MPQPFSSAGSNDVLLRAVPKLALENTPHSPLATGSSRLQSGTKLPLVSFQTRLVVESVASDATGLGASVSPVSPMPSRYLLSDTFTAVLPLPVTSQTKLLLGVT